MKKIQTFIYVLLMGFAFAACQDDSLGGSEQGGIRIALADGTAGVDVTTRSTPSELFDGFKDKFKFQIKGDNYDQTHNWTDDVIPLAAGVYDITATCGTEQAEGEIGFDKPCYTGKAEGIKVEVDKETKVEVECEVTNALVSIQFDEENKAFAEDAGAIIAVGGTDEIWGDLSKSAYFKAGSSLTKLIINRGNDVSNEADILEEVKKNPNFPKAFEAGDHLIITLSVGKANGNVAFKVSKVEVDKVTIKETIPMEWLPKPKMAVEGFDATTKMLSMYESETPTAKFNFNLSSGLQELKFTLDFKDEEYKSLNKAYTLSELSQEDKTALTGAGVILPSIGDKGKVALDFSGLAAKLTGSTEGDALDNVIKLTEVKANNRILEGGEQTYTIKTHAPEFGIKVYPGNTWTKQFTANTEITKGNAEVIREGMTFEYSTNGSNWTSSKDSLIAGLKPDTNYKVRLKFGKHYKEVDVKTYPVIELENGDMEDWNYDDGPEASWPSKGPFWKRWYVRTNKDETTDGWCSLNYYTTSNNDPKAYCSNSGTEQSSDKHSGSYAAEIKTIGWGDGTTAASPFSTIKQNTPGELFLGKINNNEKEYGIQYESRPTNLIFWYKYNPEGSHEFTAKIVIENKNENVILAEETFNGSQQDNYVEKNIFINYKDEYKHLGPTHMYILFSSGENSNSEVDKASISRGSRHTGNILYIDDIQLIYDK